MAYSNSLLYIHVYPVNNWRNVLASLTQFVPHNAICIHLSVKVLHIWKLPFFLAHIRKTITPVKIFVTINKKKFPEVNGLRKLFKWRAFKHYDILTYIHAKGVTKPQNKFIADWVEYMRYFLMDQFSLTIDLFQKGFSLYGVNLTKGNKGGYGPFSFSTFHYSGNFVSVNLKRLRTVISNTPIDDDYFGVEGYWGKLCPVEEAFCAHISSDFIINHYEEPFPPSLYRKY